MMDSERFLRGFIALTPRRTPVPNLFLRHRNKRKFGPGLRRGDSVLAASRLVISSTGAAFKAIMPVTPRPRLFFASLCWGHDA